MRFYVNHDTWHNKGCYLTSEECKIPMVAYVNIIYFFEFSNVPF